MSFPLVAFTLISQQVLMLLDSKYCNCVCKWSWYLFWSTMHLLSLSVEFTHRPRCTVAYLKAKPHICSFLFCQFSYDRIQLHFLNDILYYSTPESKHHRVISTVKMVGDLLFTNFPAIIAIFKLWSVNLTTRGRRDLPFCKLSSCNSTDRLHCLFII